VRPPVINFYWTNILSETQLKKFTTRGKSSGFSLFFPLPLLPSPLPLTALGRNTRGDAQSGHSVCELLTTRSCIHCTRCIHTHRHASGHPIVHTTSTSMRSFPSWWGKRIFAIGCSLGPPLATRKIRLREPLDRASRAFGNHKVRRNKQLQMYLFVNGLCWSILDLVVLTLI